MSRLLLRGAILAGVTYLLKRASDPPVQPVPKRPTLPNYVDRNDPLLRCTRCGHTRHNGWCQTMYCTCPEAE